MRITEISVCQSPVPLKKAFVISLGRFDHANNLLVKIRTDNNLTGFGECSPFLTINGETMESAYEVARHIAPHLIGRNPGKRPPMPLNFQKKGFRVVKVKRLIQRHQNHQTGG